jgi:hypothetical protein
MAYGTLEQQARLKRADIEYVLLAGSSVSYVNVYSYEYFCVCARVCGTSMIFKGKMAF